MYVHVISCPWLLALHNCHVMPAWCTWHPPKQLQAVAQVRVCFVAQVRQQFRPEFINRIDEFIVFQALDRLQIAQIVRLQVSSTVSMPLAY